MVQMKCVRDSCYWFFVCRSFSSLAHKCHNFFRALHRIWTNSGARVTKQTLCSVHTIQTNNNSIHSKATVANTAYIVWSFSEQTLIWRSSYVSEENGRKIVVFKRKFCQCIFISRSVELILPCDSSQLLNLPPFPPSLSLFSLSLSLYLYPLVF